MILTRNFWVKGPYTKISQAIRTGWLEAELLFLPNIKRLGKNYL